MSCCGRTRPVSRERTAAAAIGARQETAISPPSAASATRTPSAVWLRYTGGSSVRMRGPVTGREYVFSDRRLIQRIDAGDAAALVQTRLFRQTW